MCKKILLGLLFAVTSLSGVSAVPPANQIELVEFYNKSLDHYFVTTHKAEIDDLDTGVHVGWARTGYRFPVVKIGATEAGTTPTCRFYGRPEAQIDSHFYSSKLIECNDVKLKFPNEWQFESEEVFRAFAVDPNTGKCPADASPVYRLWNQRPDVNHRYTDQLSVYNEMLAKGYKAEGDGNPLLPVAFCQPSGGSVVPPPPAGSPACTLSSPTLTPALGTSQILTATCTNTPTSYIWSGCTSTTNTCTVTRTTAGNAVYGVAATNAQGTGATVTRTLNWGGVAGVLPLCTIAVNTYTPTAGGPLTLSANCSQSPTRIDFLACSYLVPDLCSFITACSSTAISCVVTQSNSGLARYAVAATNASGTGVKSSSIEVAWQPASGGGGGGGGSAPSCTASASPDNPSLGTNVTLSAYCFNSPTSYSWTGPGVTVNSGMTGTANFNVPGIQTYTVTAANAFGSGVASVNVNWGGNSGPQVPNCSITSSNIAPVVGQSITLTSSCTNAPTTYAWTNCTSSGPTCVDSATAVGVKVYTMTASNGAGAGNVAQAAIAWQPAPTAPPACTVSPSDANPFTGQTITLTATCTQSPSSGSFVWTNCTSTQATCQTTAANAGPVTYTVTAANSLGTSPPAGTVVNWQLSIGGQDFCPAYQNVVRVHLPFGPYVPPMYTANNGGFAADGVFVVSFIAPSTPASYGTPGITNIAEYNGPPTMRQMTLSASACDFRGRDPSGVSGPYAVGNGTTAGIPWNVGAAPVALVPGRTYYFNFRNWIADLGVISCALGACNAVIQVNWPK